MRKLTDFGLATLESRYLLGGETPQQMFERVAKAYSSDQGHYERMLGYITMHWFMPSTPILSNAGTDRGLPISCYLNNVDDSLNDIAATWDENVKIASKGGGIGTCWSDVRSIGEDVHGRGTSSGLIPFIKVQDSMTLAISQGSLRRGSAAAYLDISHPEIEEFLEVRKPSGDFNRKSLNIHQGVVIPDAFMECIRDGKEWALRSPVNQEVIKTVNARNLFQAIVETRLATGEPYLLFSDTVNNARPSHHKKLGLTVKQSNLCSEIVLPTGLDYDARKRTAVCCLGSVNLEYFDEWEDNQLFIEDCLRYLDNVLNDFINQTEGMAGMENARYSVMQERSIGLGAMGFHSYLQNHGIPFGSLPAKLYNNRMFRVIRERADKANGRLALELYPCNDSIASHEEVPRRFSYMLAIAPTASISIICGGTSPCIEPWNANIFTQKTLSGSFEVRNKYLVKELEKLGRNDDATWDSILENGGSVQHLDFLPDILKDVYKTAFEIDQRYILEHAADRAGYIDQAQSINLFLDGNTSKEQLLMLHYKAWEQGIKSLYYLRSKSVQRASFAGAVESDNTTDKPSIDIDYDECLSCQ